jgi:3-oxocholest-4-en-26-oate---CoA ligase
MTAWNFATIWEIAAANVPQAPAVIQGDRVIRWADFDRRADGLAASLLSTGVEHQDKVALYLYNCPEYLEACFACFKAGLVPVNTNYRYADDELAYLWDNADAVAVIFHGSFTEHVERLRSRMDKIRSWYWVDDGGGPCPEWATPYESTTDSAAGTVTAPWGRGDDDLLMIYTGGTTGMPKGVMWRQDDLVRGVIGSTAKRFRGPADYDAIRALLTRPGRVGLPACPLMHGTGWFAALALLSTAGSVVLLTSRHFDAEHLLDTFERRRVNFSAIVGDALAKPILAALDAHPDRWDLSSLMALNSSGVMWSAPIKQGLLRHLPTVQLIDNFGSSEAMGMAQSVTTSVDTVQTARFAVSDKTRVIDDDNHDVVPGSGQVGRVAVRGHQPLGYYKDPEKSARTFVTIDGDRYSIPGDYATVAGDGTLVLLGRGSVCINTGGEKVFPEEVEEALKLHPAVRDAVVVGIPHERFGESVAAVVELHGSADFDPDAIIEHVKERIASYKAPKHVLAIDTIGRSANGKVDYKRLRDFAVERLTAPAASATG